MSTPAVIPVLTQLHPISAYLKAHEKLVLTAIAGLVLWFGIGKIDALIANHDNANLHQAQVVADQQAAVNQGLAQQAAYQAAQYKELAAQVAKQNAALEQANVNLSNALIKQQHTDATLPPSELAARWNVLVPSANVVVSTNGETLPTSGAVATVQQLELVPVQQQELVAAQAEVKNDLGLISAGNASIATLNLRIDGLNLQLGDNAKVCTAQIAVVKAEARRSKRRWFYVGVVVGFIGRQLIKSETGM